MRAKGLRHVNLLCGLARYPDWWVVGSPWQRGWTALHTRSYGQWQRLCLDLNSGVRALTVSNPIAKKLAAIDPSDLPPPPFLPHELLGVDP